MSEAHLLAIYLFREMAATMGYVPLLIHHKRKQRIARRRHNILRAIQLITYRPIAHA